MGKDSTLNLPEVIWWIRSAEAPARKCVINAATHDLELSATKRTNGRRGFSSCHVTSSTVPIVIHSTAVREVCTMSRRH